MEEKIKAKIAGWLLAFLFCVLAMGLSKDATAQGRFSLQFRPGVSFPTTDFGDANLTTGFGFEVGGAYRFMPHVSVYAGWGWSHFGSNESFAGTDTDFEETGYMFGLQLVLPFNERLPFEYFLKGGAIYNHIELENADGDIFADSGHGFGFQVETGFSFSITDSWHIIPGIKYQTLTRDLAIEGVSYTVDLNYLSVGATISKSF